MLLHVTFLLTSRQTGWAGHEAGPGRPVRWSWPDPPVENPYRVGATSVWLAGDEHRIRPAPTAREPGQYGDGVPSPPARTPRPRWRALRRWAAGGYAAEARRILRGHDPARWCPPDQPCHADVLLELANQWPLAAPSR